MDFTPRLDIILVGDNAASLSYIRQKTKNAEECGIKARVHRFSSDIKEEKVREKICKLSLDPDVDGIIVQLPLPEGFDEQGLLAQVAVDKDVDGLHPSNFGCLLAGIDPCFFPPTPNGIMRLFKHYDIKLKSQSVALVGMGRLVGRPLSQMLLNCDATVLCLHEHTRDIKKYTDKSDIVVVGAGVPRLIKSEHIKKGAIVIDAGIHKIAGELVGDVDFEEVVNKASLITPVPGGVGPLTVAELLNNTYLAASRRASGDF